MILKELRPLTNTTVIIPLRVDSPQRVRNVVLVIAYLTTILRARVILQEVDTHARFLTFGMPKLMGLLPSDAKFRYVFKNEVRTDSIFHRTLVLNDLVLRTTTPYVVNHDADCILPPESYYAAVDRLSNGGAELIYPYAFGPGVQRRVFLNGAIAREFISLGYPVEVLDTISIPERAEYGFCQFFERRAYIAGYLENENFMSYGPEDLERYYRFSQLGYAVSRLDGPVYHLEHPRTANSTPSNPFMKHNVALWRSLSGLSSVELRLFYEQQRYVHRRRLQNPAVGLHWGKTSDRSPFRL
jgi:hypothetical protein